MDGRKEGRKEEWKIEWKERKEGRMERKKERKKILVEQSGNNGSRERDQKSESERKKDYTRNIGKKTNEDDDHKPGRNFPRFPGE